MFWKKEVTEKSAQINWERLESLDQLNVIKEESKTQPVLIFKHSTRCSISSMALSRLEREWNSELDQLKAYYLDLIAFRQISNTIENAFGVYHESPQVLIIKNGECIYDASHMSISVNNLKQFQ